MLLLYLPQVVLVGCRNFECSYIHKAGEEPTTMDAIVMIMFASVLCTMTALNFMELRRIRKKLESK